LKLLLQIIAIGFVFYCYSILYRNAKTLGNFSSDFEWMLGNWVAPFQESTILEKWEKDQQSYKGKAEVYSNQTLNFSEDIEIYANENNWYYCPNIKGNKIPFRIIESTQNSFTAINLKNEFPQIISYTKNSRDSLTAFVCGFEHSAFKKQYFYYQLKKQ